MPPGSGQWQPQFPGGVGISYYAGSRLQLLGKVKWPGFFASCEGSTRDSVNTNDSIGYAYGIDHGTASMEKTWPA